MKPFKKELITQEMPLRFTQQPNTDVEGQLVAREFKTAIQSGPQSIGGGAGGLAGQTGSIPGIVQYTAQVGDMANAVRTACTACRHFDNRAWQKFMAAAQGPASTAESRSTIQAMRDRLKLAGKGYVDDATGEVHLDEYISTFGICRILSDWVEGAVGRNPIHWPVFAEPNATCPTYVQAEQHRMEVVTPAEPYGLFKPKDLDAQQFGAKRYDAVLFEASGKTK